MMPPPYQAAGDSFFAATGCHRIFSTGSNPKPSGLIQRFGG